MFREVSRNKKQIMSQERCDEILNKATSGVLNLMGDDDYPYGVPISFVYKNNKLYFHGMTKGHKVDAMKKHDKASFTIIDTDHVVPKEWTTYFRSVIVFGRMKFIEDNEEKKIAHAYLIDKYSPDFKEGSEADLLKRIDSVVIYEMEIDHISGKEAIEFV